MGVLPNHTQESRVVGWFLKQLQRERGRKDFKKLLAELKANTGAKK